MSDFVQCKDIAKMIRRELRAAFPGVKFSVRSDVYSMGASIRIHYSDGPTQKAVEAIAGRYKGAGFDGMIDLKYDYRFARNPENGELVCLGTDGTQNSGGTVPNSLEPIPPGWESVHLGVDYIFTERKLSEAYKARARALWAKLTPSEKCDVLNDSNFRKGWGRDFSDDEENALGFAYFLGEADLSEAERIVEAHPASEESAHA